MSDESSRSAPRRRGRKDRPQAVPKRPLTLKISDEAYRRLAVHAAYERVNLSAIVERLLLEHLKRYRVSDLASADPPDTAAA